MARADAEGDEIPAGRFGPWVTGVQAALRGEQDADVPCHGCTACCRSGQFVHVDPDETDALAHIPSELLFPAPGMPRGHRLLGYDERGHCPMLVDDRCSIYDHRPRACRMYDCRVFAAAGVEPDAASPVRDRVERWRFVFDTAEDRERFDAVRRAAAALRDDDVRAPAAQIAVRAVESHDLDAADRPPPHGR
jgi:uncharacterized protein